MSFYRNPAGPRPVSASARAYRHVFENAPLFRIRHGHELLPKVMLHEVKVMNRGFCIFIYGAPSGKTGEAKTWTVESLAQAIAPFTFERADMTRSIESFLKRLRYHRDKGHRGRVVVLDESQKSIPSQAYMSAFNKIAASSVSLMRKFGCIAIFIAPLSSWMDKRVRSMIRYGGYSVLTYKNGELRAYLNFGHVQTDVEVENTYRPRLMAYDERIKRKVIVAGFVVKAPTRDIREPIDEDELEYKLKEMDRDAESARIIESAEDEFKVESIFDPALLYDNVLANSTLKRVLQTKNGLTTGLVGGQKPFNRLSKDKRVTLVAYVNERWRGELEDKLNEKVVPNVS